MPIFVLLLDEESNHRSPAARALPPPSVDGAEVAIWYWSAYAFTSPILVATVLIFEELPATDVTLELIPATVVTLALIPATVFILVLLPATVLMFVALDTAELILLELLFTALILDIFALTVVKAVLLAEDNQVFSK